MACDGLNLGKTNGNHHITARQFPQKNPEAAGE
jgi:hypothetical protein